MTRPWPPSSSPTPAPGFLRGRPRAFSLIEILIVLAILAILSSVAVFSYGSYQKNQSVRGTAQEVAALFATARSLAINSNRPHRATIDLDLRAFWIDELDPTGTTVSRPKVVGGGKPLDGVVLQDVQLTAGLRTTGMVPIRFWPDGRGTYAIVHIRRELDDPALSSSYFSIRVFPSTGTAQVLPNERR